MKICDEKNLKFKNKRKSEALTIDDIMLNCETKDFSKSSYTNREINKSDTFCTLSIDYVASICHLKSKLCNLYTTHLPSSPRQLTNT